MGSFAKLQFDGYQIEETKDYLDVWLFQNIDQKIFERKREEDEEIETAYVFEVSIETMIKRLEVLGFTMEAVRIDFEKCIAKAIKRNRERSEGHKEGTSEFTRLKKEAFSEPFEKWIVALRTIFDRKLQPVSFYAEPSYQPIEAHPDTLINYMLNAERDPDDYNFQTYHSYVLGYLTSQSNYFARVALELLDRKGFVVLDATHLVHAGIYNGFDLLMDIQKPHTVHYEDLSSSFDELEALPESVNDDRKKPLVAKLLFAHAIAIMEAYLSDTLMSMVQRFPALIRRIVETEKEFQSETIKTSDLYRRHEKLPKDAITYLQKKILYHRLQDVKRIYKSVLLVDLPEDITSLMDAIEVRHGIVHRNGKARDGRPHNITFDAVTELISAIRSMAQDIDRQVKNIYVGMWEENTPEIPPES